MATGPGPFCRCWAIDLKVPGLQRSREAENADGVDDKDDNANGKKEKIWDNRPPPRYTCRCGERSHEHEWRWSVADENSAFLCERGLEVTFHRVFSSGTAVVQGTKPFASDRIYYWEIKILTQLYGTDVMIGVGSQLVDYTSGRHLHESFLGLDSESYGFSYKGTIQHGGRRQRYCSGFGKGAIVGAYLDMWQGTLEFYVNRKPMGIAFRGLKRHCKLYPMLCSTASQSAVRLIYSMSLPASLVYHAAKAMVESGSTTQSFENIPGLKLFFQRAFWVFLPTLDDDGEICGWENHKNNEQNKSYFFNEVGSDSSESYKSLFKYASNDTTLTEISDLWDPIPDQESQSSNSPQRNVIKISARRRKALCERCNTRNAVVYKQNLQNQEENICFQCHQTT